MRFGTPQHPEEAGFDLTPMIDVTMLLIIFFAFTAQFTRSLATPMDLPREQGESPSANAAPKSLVIDITREGVYRIMGQDLSLEWVVQTVASDVRRAGGAEKIDIIVRADRSASAQHLNNLAAALTRAGVRTWKFATAQEGA